MIFFTPKTDKIMANPFDITKVQDDIDEALKDKHPLVTYLPEPGRLATPPLPAYVEHHIDVDQVGRLSAEAIVQQYEATAKSIEAMGVELIDCARKAEAMAMDVADAIAYLQETAQKYRDEAKVIFERIETASRMTKEVRSTCNTLRDKIEKGEH